jgi:hypothetical protein
MERVSARAAPNAASTTLQRKSAGQAAPTHVPPIVHEVLNSPGQPLDAATRAYMEPRFGHDFSKVRVHADGKAGELSISEPGDPCERDADQTADAVMRMQNTPAGSGRDFSRVRIHTDRMAAESAGVVNARAYTVGHHVVFGRELFSPGSEAGRRLLGHELVHVVQQQSTGVAKVQRQSIGHDEAPRKPLRYGEGVMPKIQVPPKPYTLQDAKGSVDQRVKEKALTKGDVKGAPAKSDAEIFLWYILGYVASHDRWGTEYDLIAPIGWPPTNPGGSAQATAAPRSAPVAEVTVRIDDKGVGVAELVSSKAVAPPKISPDKAKAKADLIATYGLKSVEGNWDLDELNLVLGAFALMKTQDRAALVEVDLERVEVIDADPEKAGQALTGPLSVGETTKVASQTATLVLSNLAFPKETTQFVGSGAQPLPRSYQAILHEVGHFVENKAQRDADPLRAAATIAFNATGGPAGAASTLRSNTVNELNALIKDYTDTDARRKEAYNARPQNPMMIESLEAELKKKESAIDAKQKLVDDLKKDEADKVAAAKGAKETATKAAEAAKATRVPESVVAAGKAEMVTAGSKAKAALGEAGKQSFDAKAKSASARRLKPSQRNSLIMLPPSTPAKLTQTLGIRSSMRPSTSATSKRRNLRLPRRPTLRLRHLPRSKPRRACGRTR